MSDQVSRTSESRIARPAIRFEMVMLVLSLACLAGCGRGEVLQRAPVDGLVTIDGAPLTSGTICFIPTGDTKGPAAAATIEDGTYELPKENGPLVGQHRIEIEATNHLGFELDDERAYAMKVEQGRQMARNPIPESFNRQSKLMIDIPEEGRTNLDFRLKSTGVLADSR